MGILGHIASEAATDAAFRFSGQSEIRREQKKWTAVFAVFALMGMLAFYIQEHSMDDADLLGGRDTVKHFMRSNVIAMSILIIAAIGFIILVFNTWKKERSLPQFAMTICSAVVLLLCGFSIFRSIHNIQKDLDSPLTITADSYVLCKEGKDCMLVFDQQGTSDAVLLVIPQEKYNELKNGVISKKGYASRSWRLIENEQYRDFTDAVYFESKINVTYYRHSIIYEDCSLLSNSEA